jgi:diguanylate cyclase (GGDEF)-like protein
MELRALLRLLLVHWWIILPIFLITLGSSVVFTLGQAPVYQSSATYIVKPNASFQEDLLAALATVSRQSQITSTYAEVASSRALRRQAAADIGLGGGDRQDIEVSTRLVAGTNILEVSVRALDPTLARDYCRALGDALVAYVEGLYDAYRLAALDAPGLPDRPVAPNVPLNVTLGGALGMGLGLGAAFVVHLLSIRPRRVAQVNILDEETGAYNLAYFSLRLREEMSRSRRSKAPLGVALMNVNNHGALDETSIQVRKEALRKLAGMIESHLRTEDLLARIDDTVFAFLLPDLRQDQAVELIEGLRTRIALPALDVDQHGDAIRANGAAGVVVYRGEPLDDEGLLAAARKALKDAETIPSGKVMGLSLVGEGREGADAREALGQVPVGTGSR